MKTIKGLAIPKIQLKLGGKYKNDLILREQQALEPNMVANIRPAITRATSLSCNTSSQAGYPIGVNVPVPHNDEGPIF